MQAIKTTKKILLNPLDPNSGEFLLFKVNPNNTSINPYTKELKVSLDTFILKEITEIKEVLDGNGSPTFNEDGSFKSEEVTRLTTKRINLGELFSDTFTATDVETVITALNLTGNHLDNICEAILQSVSSKISSSLNINLDASDLEEVTIN